jgi:hypothetical protein
MQNAAKISPTNFRVTSVLGTKREGDETARGLNDHKACVLYAKNITVHRDLACQQARSRYKGKLFVSYERSLTFHIIFITRRYLTCERVKNVFSLTNRDNFSSYEMVLKSVFH